ncbi:MAG: putative quinol monooxygenase [Mycobacterium sp.]
MTLILIAELHAKPGRSDEVLRALTDMIAPSEAEPGCVSYRPLVDPSGEGKILCLEEWVDEEALEHHFATPYFKDVAALFDDLLAEPFQLRRLRPQSDG